MKRTSIFSAILFACTALAARSGPTASRLPANHPVDIWLKQVKSPDPLVRRQTPRCPASLGPDRHTSALALVQALADKRPYVRRYAADAIGEYELEPELTVDPLIQALQDRDPAVRDHSVIALTKIGQPAIPRLLSVVRGQLKHASAHDADDSRQTIEDYAALVLAGIGPPSVRVILTKPRKIDDLNPYERFILHRQPDAAAEAYRDFLRLPDEKIQLIALEALTEFEEAAQVAVPELVSLLERGTKQQRRAAAGTLQYLGRGGAAAVPALIDALESQDADIRMAAIEALAKINSHPELSVPAVIRLLKDPDVDVRNSALWTLKLMGSNASPACPVVRSIIGQPGFHDVLEAIGSVCYGDRAAIEAVLPFTSDPESMLPAVSTLAALGPEAVPDLVNLYHQGGTDLRFRVIQALSEIDSPSVVSVMTEALADPDAAIVHWATSELAYFGPAAQAAMPELIRNYRANRNRARLNCVLARIGPGAMDILPVLIEVARDKASYDQIEDPSLRDIGDCSILDVFVNIGPTSVPALVQLLSCPHFVEDSLQGLLELGGVPVDAAPAVAALLHDPNHAERAAKLLSKMGNDGLPELSKATKDADPHVREEALGAIAQMHRPCYTVVPILRDSLRDPYLEVRVGAGRVLENCPEVASEIALLKNDPDPAVRQAFRHVRSEPSLLERFLYGPAEDRPTFAGQIEQLGEQAAPLIPGLRAALASSDEQLATDAALLLFQLDRGPDDEAYRSLLLDSFVASYIARNMRSVELATGEITLHKKTGREPQLPDLPWPVPKPSRIDTIPTHLLGGDAKTMGSVYATLDYALRQVGFTETGLFAVPSGFAIVTPVERVHPEDVTSFKEPDRWTSGKLPLSSFSLSDYLQSLFLDHPGQFRFFIFLVTDRNPEPSNKMLTEKEARDLTMKGGKLLPDSIARASFANEECYVLLYHFERKIGGEAAELSPSPFPISTHLTRLGLTQFVQ